MERADKAFTLLELLVSIAIIALLASFILAGAFQVMKLVRKIMKMAGQ